MYLASIDEIQWLREPRPVSGEEIRALEAQLSVELPVDYRNSILKLQGGLPSSHTDFDFSQVTGKEHNAAVAAFLSVDAGTDSIFSCLERHADRLPPDVVPIVEAAGGDLVCIDFREDSRPLKYWHHGRIGQSDEWSYLCSDFLSFLSMLYDGDDGDDDDWDWD